jgi:hypothetical protein
LYRVRAIEEGQLNPTNNQLKIYWGTDDWNEIANCYGEVFIWEAVFSNCLESKFYSGNITVVAECAYNKTIDSVLQKRNIADISLYPNPVKDIVTINVKYLNNPTLTVVIRNILGNEVYRANLIGGENLIDISFLPSGNYHAQILDNNITLSNLKFVKLSN